MDVPADMKAAGIEFAAAEHADAAKVEKRVEAMNAATTASAPGAGQTEAAVDQVPGQTAAAAPAPAALPDKQTVEFLESLIAVADRFVVGFTTKDLALTKDEQTQIAQAATPVLNKHLPDIIRRLTETVEGQLVLTVAFIYAKKAPALLTSSPAKIDEKKPEPPAAPAEAKA